MSGEKPVDVRVGVKPVFVQLLHSGPYEGPCRTGTKERLDPEAENRRAQERFEGLAGELEETFPPAARLLEPVRFQWKDDWAIPEKELQKLEDDLSEVDLFLIMGGLSQYPAVAIAERFGKPVASVGAVATVDIAAGLRSRGLEGYAPLDWAEFADLVELLRVRKAIGSTRILFGTHGDDISVGVVSTISDWQALNARYGVEHHSIPVSTMFQRMAQLPEESVAQAVELTDRLIANAEEVHMEREDLQQSVKFYVTVKESLEELDCQAFTIPCFEVCASQVAQDNRVVFCLTHSLLKDEGYPSACEADVNVLMAISVLMYLSRKSVYMGNSYIEDKERNLIRVHHDVPGLKMNGLDAPDLSYQIRPFTTAGWGAVLRHDFSEESGQPVTLARFDPRAERLLVAGGELVDCGGMDGLGCSLSAVIEVSDAVELFHQEADFGHHLAMVYGDYVGKLQELSRLMDFEVTAV